MARRNLKLLRAFPGAPSLRPIFERFFKREGGILTALSDASLRACAGLVPEESEVECVPFGEVVARFLALAGGDRVTLAQRGHINAAVVEACLNIPKESPLFDSKNFAGLHRTVASGLDELRAWGYGQDELLIASERLPGRLGTKLRSLAEVDDHVDRILGTLARRTNSDQIRACLELRPERALGIRLLVVAGSHDDPLDLAWLRWAESSGAEILVVTERALSDDLFQGAKEIVTALDVEPEPVGEPNILAGRVFGGAGRGTPLDVKITSSANPLGEAEWALRRCLEEYERGVPFSGLAILARNMDSYAPLIEAAAKRLAVPVRVPRRAPLLSNSFAKLTLEVLRFCASDDVRKLSPLIRSSYLQLTRAEQVAIGGVLKEAFRSKDRQWQILTEWANAHQEDQAWLGSLLEWRERAISEPAPLGDWLARFMELGHQPWHEKALQGDVPTHRRDQHAQSAMQRALAQTASVDRVGPRRELSLKQFVALCGELWKEAETSIPTADFGIQVARSAEELGETEVLFVMGMLEGVFPRRRSEDPLLNDGERAQLDSLFPDKTPLKSSFRRAKEERDEFYRVCCTPTKRLILSYPLTDEDRDNVRAFYLSEVERALGEMSTEHHGRTQLVPELPRAPKDRELAEALSGAREEPLANEIHSGRARNLVRGGVDRELSPKELRDVLRCPFQFLGRRRLNLFPNRPQSRWSHLMSLPVKANLAGQLSEESAAKSLENQLEVELSELYGETSEDDLVLMRTGGQRLIQEWVEREFAARKLWPREHVSSQFAGYDAGDLRKAMKVDDKTIRLTGDVPAVSMRGEHNVVHLFKGHDPWDEFGDRREERPWRRLKEQDRFEILLYLATSYRRDGGGGVEIDSAGGGRRLFLMPRPADGVRANPAAGFCVNYIGAEDMTDLFKEMSWLVSAGVRRIDEAVVEPTPGEQCEYCDHGELCRRSRDFGEDLDPFAPTAQDEDIDD